MAPPLSSPTHTATLSAASELADSITIDPHKWLAMPFAAGVVLTSHPLLLESAFAVTTPYMPRTPGATQIDNFKISTQWSRRMNSLKFWITLRVHGRKAYEDLIHRQLELARNFSRWIEHSEYFAMAAPQVLPIINFRVKNADKISEDQLAAANSAIVDAITNDGSQWISLTRVNGNSVIRMMVISYLTEERHLAQLQDRLTLAARKLFASSAASR